MEKYMAGVNFRGGDRSGRILPEVVGIGAAVTVRDPLSGGTRDLSVHDRYGEWTLMGVLRLEGGHAAAVFEDLGEQGMIVYASRRGIELRLAKRLESTYADESRCYRGHPKEEIVSSPADILGKEILSTGEDPDFDDVASCFPPIRDSRYGTEEGIHTFVGTREGVDILPVYYGAEKGIWRVNPLYISGEINASIHSHTVCEGLVGGWLPVVRMVYPVAEEVWWESVTFAKADMPNPYIQPAWYRYVKIDHGTIVEIRYIDSYLPYPVEDTPDPADFYRDLYRLHTYWNEQIGDGMSVDVPEKWLSDFCRHSFVMEMISRIGDHPRYGVVNKIYGGPEHDGFMDTLNAAVEGYLEWGMIPTARRYLDYYLTHFVRPNGLIEYRGPEMGQYARLLVNLAQYYDYTGDGEFLRKYEQKLCAIASMLLSRRETARRKPKDDPAYGLIAGRHEADIGFLQTGILSQDFEIPYYSNSAQAWRGLRDMGRAWRSIGEKARVPGLIARGERYLRGAEGLGEDLVSSMDASVLRDRDLPYLPPIAGSKEYYYDMPYRACPASYDDNRVWCEMMHAGVVPTDTVDMILAHSREHQTMRMGIFGNRWAIVAFLCNGEAYGLIQHDRIREFLLMYYSHILHAHTRGTWTVSECVDMDRDRGNYAPFCGPAQMTIPTVTKWMLVFEDPLTEQLWLAKAVPRTWLQNGKEIRVANAPVRNGHVSYEIRSALSEGEITASIEYPGGTAVVLRLRAPAPFRMKAVRINGQTWGGFDPGDETVRLPMDMPGPVRVEISY